MPDLTHGPLVGATTADGVAIWLRADGPAEVEVRVAAAADLSGANPGTATTVRLEAERDFTAVLFCTGLTPDTAYVYRVLLDGQAALFPNFDRQASFRTFPAPDEEAPSFSFAFGSCFNAEYHEDVIFNNLIRQEGAGDPRFFLMIGDNTYVDYFAESRNERDSPPVGGLLALYRASYRASWRHPIFRRALMSTPTFMIFDDHEIWNNWNNSLDFQHDREALAAGARAYWEYQDSHNPAAAARHAGAEPTYHYSFSYGKDIGFFVLDCRMRRNPKAVPFPTILGEEQRVALFQWLRDHKSDYRAKFIVSSVPISFVALPHTIIRLLHSELGDQWIGYPEERLELFKFIQQEQIEGVHFLSGDIHLGQGLAIKAAAEQPGPTVYGYTSSPLANAFYLLPGENAVVVQHGLWDSGRPASGLCGGPFPARNRLRLGRGRRTARRGHCGPAVAPLAHSGRSPVREKARHRRSVPVPAAADLCPPGLFSPPGRRRERRNQGRRCPLHPGEPVCGGQCLQPGHCHGGPRAG